MATDSLERYLESQSGLPNPSVLSSGDCIGGWRVCALIGRGGTSEVYRVERAVDGFVAALKLLKVGGESDMRHRSRFLREVKLLAETASPCFPRLYASGETESGSPYLVEELLESRELPRTDRAVAEYVLSVCRGVGELHRRGIVHRDLKPANIIFRADGTAVIADLGLAKDSVASVGNAGVSIADGHPVGVGTPGYSAPEQFLNGEASSASDIHAIGVLIDACFRGVAPRAWRGIVRRATSSLPAQRYSSVAELVCAVRHRHLGRNLALFVVIIFGVLLLFSQSPRQTAGQQSESSTIALPVERQDPVSVSPARNSPARASAPDDDSARLYKVTTDSRELLRLENSVTSDPGSDL